MVDSECRMLPSNNGNVLSEGLGWKHVLGVGEGDIRLSEGGILILQGKLSLRRRHEFRHELQATA